MFDQSLDWENDKDSYYNRIYSIYCTRDVRELIWTAFQHDISDQAQIAA